MRRSIPILTLLMFLLTGAWTIDVRAQGPVPADKKGQVPGDRQSPPPVDMQSGSLLFRMQEGYVTATLLNTDVTMNISGLVARVSVRRQ
jgi:hypothetical protein